MKPIKTSHVPEFSRLDKNLFQTTKMCGRDPTQELERCASKERKSFLPNIFTRKDKFEEKIQVKETGESLLQPWGGYKNDGTGHGG